MKHKAKKYPKLDEWKRVMERHREKVRMLEKKVRMLEALLHDSRQLTPDKLNELGTYVHSVLPKDETLQERMCRYCDMAGYEYRKKGKAIEYDTPSGTTVTIYPWPVRHFGWNQKWDFYGHLDKHDRWGVKYITESMAQHLYDLLGKKIEELERTGGTRDAHESDR